VLPEFILKTMNTVGYLYFGIWARSTNSFSFRIAYESPIEGLSFANPILVNFKNDTSKEILLSIPKG
jgi:hypothetical protein